MLHLVPTLQRMRVNLRIFRVVLNGYKTGKSPERHSGTLAGIQGLESLLDPGQMPAGVTICVCSRTPKHTKVHPILLS
jgi:hypothetical protein